MGASPAHQRPAVTVGGHSLFSLQAPVHVTAAPSAKLCAREIREKTFYLTEKAPPDPDRVPGLPRSNLAKDHEVDLRVLQILFGGERERETGRTLRHNVEFVVFRAQSFFFISQGITNTLRSCLRAPDSKYAHHTQQTSVPSWSIQLGYLGK